jgi:sphingomyelin phosphodiesterase acid-like 3
MRRWIFLLSAGLSLGLAVTAAMGQSARATRSVLLLSDVHLNPFPTTQQCQTGSGKEAFARLAGKPAMQWKPEDFSFESGSNGYGEDTNEALFESALNAMQQAVPKPQVIVVPGDFLAHGFRGLWRACHSSGFEDEAAYRDFTAKTIEFVLLRLAAKFPHAQIVPVLGNNDSDRGDYGVPSAEWLRLLAKELPGITENQGKTADWSHYATGGYYSTKLRDFPGVEVLALNSVLWSPKCKSEALADCTSDGVAELEWMEARMKAARARGGSIVVTGHIPPGINGFETLHSQVGQIVMMYEDCGEAGAAKSCVDFGHKVPALLAEYSDVIRAGIFGHTHMNEFRVAGKGRKSVAIQVVPSVTPIYLNNPAFLVAQVSPEFSIEDYQAWRLSLGSSAAGSGWAKEYDFAETYGAGGLSGTHMQQVGEELMKEPEMRKKYFQYLVSESARISAPTGMQSEYLCILTNLTPEAALPCVMPEMGLP